MGKLDSMAMRALVCAAAMLFAGTVRAAPGDVDPTFAYVQPAAGAYDFSRYLPVPGGGWIALRSVVSGPAASPTTRIEVRRLDAEGALVPSFGTGGTTLVSLAGNVSVLDAAIRLPDGRLLLGGSAPRQSGETVAAILRLDAAGRIDTTFGDGGVFRTQIPDGQGHIEALRMLSDGRILAAGSGSLSDGTASDCGRPVHSVLLRVSADGRTSDVLRDRKIESSEDCWRAYELLPLDGTPASFGDATLYNDGLEVTAIDADGRSLAIFGTASLLERQVARSVRDATGGFALALPSSTTYLEDPNGFIVARYDARGVRLNPMRSYTDPYPVVGPCYGPQRLAVDPSGLAWYAACRTEVWRFSADGSLDTSWGTGGRVALPGSYISDVEVQSGGRVVVGLADGRLLRLLGGRGVARGGIGIERVALFIERDATYSLMVSRTGGSAGPVSVTYSVRETPIPAGSSSVGVATAGTDFVATTGRIDWGDGESGDKRIPITIKADTVREPNEYFQVTLDSVSGGAVLFGATAEVGILDTTPPQTAPAASGGAGGGGGGGAFDLGAIVALGLVALAAVRRRASVASLAALACMVQATFGIPDAHAAPGDVDPTFAYQAPAAGSFDSAAYVAMPGGGWMAVTVAAAAAGASPSTRIELRRVDVDGRLVASFGTGGISTPILQRRFKLWLASRTPDGRVLLAGSVDDDPSAPLAAIVRFDAAGRPDASFGTGGVFTATLPGKSPRFEAVRAFDDGSLFAAGADDEPPPSFYPMDCQIPGRTRLMKIAGDGRSSSTFFDTVINDESDCWRTRDLQPLDATTTLYNDGARVQALRRDGTLITEFGRDGYLSPQYVGLAAPDVGGGFALLEVGQTAPGYIGGWTLGRFDGAGRRLNGVRSRTDPYPVMGGCNRPNRFSWDASRGIGYTACSSDVSRFRADGSADTSWGTAGSLDVVGSDNAVVEFVDAQSDGRVVIGYSDGRMRRVVGGAGVARGGIGIAPAATLTPRAATESIAVSRSGGSTGAVSVDYAIEEDPQASTATRAIAGTDFVAARGRIDWADGETGDKSIPLTLKAGTPSSQSRSLRITLSNTTGGALLFGSQATVYLAPTLAATPGQAPGTSTPSTPAASSSGGGGGALSLAELLALALGALLPAFTTRIRRLVASRSAPPAPGRE